MGDHLSFAQGVRDDPRDHITAHPIFMVQERRRIWGMHPDHADSVVWIDDEGCEVNLEALACECDELAGLDSWEREDWAKDRGYSKSGYRDEWVHRQPFFTRAGAEEYIRINGHNLESPRIWVESAYRNVEWQEVRRQCFDDTTPAQPEDGGRDA